MFNTFFSIYPKIQGFIDECVYIYILYFAFCAGKVTSRLCRYPMGHSAYSLRLKNFVEIALASSVSEINLFLRFTQKVKMATKISGKMIFEYPVGQKFRRNCSSSHQFQDKRIFVFSALEKSCRLVNC